MWYRNGFKRLRRSDPIRSDHNALAARALEVIRADARTSGLRALDIARRLAVSDKTLRAAVHARTGDHVPVAINRARIEWAKGPLATSNAPVKVIARDAGDARESDFDSWFKRFTGGTPTEWRLRHRRESADWRRQVKWPDASACE